MNTCVNAHDENCPRVLERPCAMERPSVNIHLLPSTLYNFHSSPGSQSASVQSYKYKVLNIKAAKGAASSTPEKVSIYTPTRCSPSTLWHPRTQSKLFVSFCLLLHPDQQSVMYLLQSSGDEYLATHFTGCLHDCCETTEIVPKIDFAVYCSASHVSKGTLLEVTGSQPSSGSCPPASATGVSGANRKCHAQRTLLRTHQLLDSLV